jgi:hypothetical protein
MAFAGKESIPLAQLVINTPTHSPSQLPKLQAQP